MDIVANINPPGSRSVVFTKNETPTNTRITIYKHSNFVLVVYDEYDYFVCPLIFNHLPYSLQNMYGIVLGYHQYGLGVQKSHPCSVW